YLRRRLSEKGTGLFKPCFKPCKSPVPFWDGLSVDKVGNVALGRRRFFLTVVITVAQDAISAGAVLWTMALSATVGVRKKHVAGLLAGLRLVMATGALHHAVATMAESAMLQPAPGDCSRLILRQTPGT